MAQSRELAFQAGQDVATKTITGGAATTGLVDELQPRTKGDIIRLAVEVSKTQMVPKIYQNKPDETAVAMLMAHEAGVGVLTGLSFIGVINGKPAWYGDATPGIAKAKGLITGYKEWFEGEEDTDAWTAFCTVFTPSGLEYTNKFSQKDAKRAKLHGKEGPWKLYPQRMMIWRARAWAIRDAAPNAFFGPTYEELQDAAINHHGPDNAKLVAGPAGNLDAFADKHGKKDELKTEPLPDDKPEPAPERLQRQTTAPAEDGPPAGLFPEDDGQSTPCAPETSDGAAPDLDQVVSVWLNKDNPTYEVKLGDFTRVFTKALQRAASPETVGVLVANNMQVMNLLQQEDAKALEAVIEERERILKD